jgi:hypothetical protein
MTYPDDNDRRPMNTVRDDSNTLGWAAGAVAVIAVIGALFYFMSDGSNTTASNTSPGTTTGSSTSAPARPAPAAPPASTPSK